MTETGMCLGTPHYMSPEQAMGEREITARSDVYALGCVLYEMLVGEPPFTGPTAQAIIARVMTEEPRALMLKRHTIPPHVEAAVLTALEKLPADRFATRGGVRGGAGAAGGQRRWSPAAVPAATRIATVRARLVAVPCGSGGARVGWRRMGLGGSSSAPAWRYWPVRASGWSLCWLPGRWRSRPMASRSPSWNRDPRPHLAQAPRRSPGPPRSRARRMASFPTFSPDGQWIAFLAGTRLKKVRPGEGGAVVTLADSVDRTQGGGGVAWLDDGNIVFIRAGGIGAHASGGKRRSSRTEVLTR